MTAVTIYLPEPLDAQIERVAKENGLTLSDFIVEVSRDIVKQDEARRRFLERAEIGKDKVDAALALLRRE